MNGETEKIFEGSYLYFQGGQNYSEENFTVELVTSLGNVIYASEILSRVDTGEFFKMRVRYEVNKFYVPQTILIEKFLGERHTSERYTTDPNNQTLTYHFSGDSGEHKIERPFGAKHFIMAPNFLTAALFTLTKKIETSARTPVTFITCPNEWDFQRPPEDKTLFVQMNTHAAQDLVVNGSPLSCIQYEIFEEDSLTGGGAPAAQLWVSKHYGVPYQFEDKSGTRMTIKRLKKLKTDPDKIF